MTNSLPELFDMDKATKKYQSMTLQEQLHLILKFKKINSHAKATESALIAFLAFDMESMK